MNHALAINVCIILLVLVALVLTSEPVTLLALTLLREMPYGLLAQGNNDDDETDEQGRPIGFVHHES